MNVRVSVSVFLFECGESWRQLSPRVSESALIGKTWLCTSRQWLIPQAAAGMCLRALPPPSHRRRFLATIPCLSDSIGFYVRPHSAGLVFSQWALVPAYLKWMVLPWSGSAACYDDCKYGSTVPGGYTICTCSFVFEYKSKCPPYALFPPLVLPSLCLLHHASVLFP